MKDDIVVLAGQHLGARGRIRRHTAPIDGAAKQGTHGLDEHVRGVWGRPAPVAAGEDHAAVNNLERLRAGGCLCGMEDGVPLLACRGAEVRPFRAFEVAGDQPRQRSWVRALRRRWWRALDGKPAVAPEVRRAVLRPHPDPLAVRHAHLPDGAAVARDLADKVRRAGVGYFAAHTVEEARAETRALITNLKSHSITNDAWTRDKLDTASAGIQAILDRIDELRREVGR